MTSARGEYVLADAAFDSELARIRLLERLYDPTTAARLDAIPVEPGWRCLEIGAGGGSVGRLLADRVGPTGKVVAVDMNTRFLQDIGDPTIEVRESDVRTDELDDGYDFVHTRFVLMHVPDAVATAAKLIRSLRPGGVYLFEEGDFTGTGPIGRSTRHAAGARTTIDAVIRFAIEGQIFDPYCGRTLAACVERAEASSAVEIFRGGTPGAEWHLASLETLRRPMVEAGALTDGVFDELGLVLNDTHATFAGVARVGVCGRRS
jgi:SAM-dependent methyltransferase